MELKEVKNIKGLVKEQVNRIDPWHLLEMSAPDDEYNSHIDRIVSFVINSKPDQSALESELHKIFKTEEHELDASEIQEMAKNIISIEYH